jgi:hypothetical protein
MWITVVVGFMQMLPGAGQENHPLVDATFIGFSTIATLLILAHGQSAQTASLPQTAVPAVDSRWDVGTKHALVWAGVPVMLLSITSLSMAMQDGPAAGARLRFGPDAYWKEALRVVGNWAVVGKTSEVGGAVAKTEPPGIRTIEFARDRSITLTLRNGETIVDTHTWRHKDSVVWLEWFSAAPRHPEQESIPLTFDGGAIYIPWSQGDGQDGYLLLRRSPAK